MARINASGTLGEGTLTFPGSGTRVYIAQGGAGTVAAASGTAITDTNILQFSVNEAEGNSDNTITFTAQDCVIKCSTLFRQRGTGTAGAGSQPTINLTRVTVVMDQVDGNDRWEVNLNATDCIFLYDDHAGATDASAGWGNFGNQNNGPHRAGRWNLTRCTFSFNHGRFLFINAMLAGSSFTDVSFVSGNRGCYAELPYVDFGAPTFGDFVRQDATFTAGRALSWRQTGGIERDTISRQNNWIMHPQMNFSDTTFTANRFVAVDGNVALFLPNLYLPNLGGNTFQYVYGESTTTSNDNNSELHIGTGWNPNVNTNNADWRLFWDNSNTGFQLYSFPTSKGTTNTNKPSTVAPGFRYSSTDTNGLFLEEQLQEALTTTNYQIQASLPGSYSAKAARLYDFKTQVGTEIGTTISFPAIAAGMDRAEALIAEPTTIINEVLSDATGAISWTQEDVRNYTADAAIPAALTEAVALAWSDQSPANWYGGIKARFIEDDMRADADFDTEGFPFVGTAADTLEGVTSHLSTTVTLSTTATGISYDEGTNQWTVQAPSTGLAAWSGTIRVGLFGWGGLSFPEGVTIDGGTQNVVGPLDGVTWTAANNPTVALTGLSGTITFAQAFGSFTGMFTVTSSAAVTVQATAEQQAMVTLGTNSNITFEAPAVVRNVTIPAHATQGGFWAVDSADLPQDRIIRMNGNVVAKNDVQVMTAGTDVTLTLSDADNWVAGDQIIVYLKYNSTIDSDLDKVFQELRLVGTWSATQDIIFANPTPVSDALLTGIVLPTGFDISFENVGDDDSQNPGTPLTNNIVNVSRTGGGDAGIETLQRQLNAQAIAIQIANLEAYFTAFVALGSRTTPMFTFAAANGIQWDLEMANLRFRTPQLNSNNRRVQQIVWNWSALGTVVTFFNGGALSRDGAVEILPQTAQQAELATVVAAVDASESATNVSSIRTSVDVIRPQVKNVENFAAWQARSTNGTGTSLNGIAPQPEDFNRNTDYSANLDPDVDEGV